MKLNNIILLDIFLKKTSFFSTKFRTTLNQFCRMANTGNVLMLSECNLHHSGRHTKMSNILKKKKKMKQSKRLNEWSLVSYRELRIHKKKGGNRTTELLWARIGHLISS